LNFGEKEKKNPKKNNCQWVCMQKLLVCITKVTTAAGLYGSTLPGQRERSISFGY
jgi:hypothetical protein